MWDTTKRKLGEAVGVSGRTEGGEEARTAPFFISALFPDRPAPTLPPPAAFLISRKQSPCYHLAA